MKKLRRLMFLVIGTFIIIFGCKKDPLINMPGGHTNPDTGLTSFQLSIDSLPGETNPVNGLYAIISFTNIQNEPVLTDKKLPLQYTGKYVSDSITLPGVTYKVSKCLIITDSGITRFATPISGSNKATLVQKPLPFSFDLPKQKSSLVRIEVARIAPGDQPEAFGYPAGSFHKPVNDTPGNPNAYFNIMVHPIIKIGDVVYDSVPVSYSMTTWNATGETSTKSGQWNPGKNDVMLSRAAIKYQFTVSKWGTTDNITVASNEIHDGTVYVLGGSKTAKKLTSVLTYKLVGESYKPVTRDTYEYDASGKVIQVVYWKKKEDNSNYIAITEKLHYNNMGKVDEIKQYDGTNSLRSETNFMYNQQGKIVYMEQVESGNKTTAKVEYASMPGNTGITGNSRISIFYQYGNSNNSMNYTKLFQGGNNVQDASITSNQSREEGSYRYDFNINPYIHVNRPDIFLSQSSKNNVIAQAKTFSGNYPEVEPYDYTYEYDADGYPEEVIKSYKSFATGRYLYKEKTVFNY